VNCLAFSPDGTQLAAYVSRYQHPTEELAVWDLSTGKRLLFHELKAPYRPGAGGVTVESIAFSPDGKSMVTGGCNYALLSWDTVTWHATRHPQWNVKSVLHLVFDAKGEGLFAAGSTKNYQVAAWNMPSGKERFSVTLPDIGAEGLAISPDGTVLVSANQGTVQVWDAKTGQERWRFNAHANGDGVEGVDGVVFLPDGETFATGGLDGKVRLWNLNQKKQVAELSGRIESPHVRDISSDGALLVVTGVDREFKRGEVEVWNLPRRQVQARFHIPNEGVMCARFSPDRKWLAMGTRGDRSKDGPSFEGGLEVREVSGILAKGLD
jgi:WD40 repeat protein